MLDFITQERAYIFRILHISNLAWILKNGVHCRNSNLYDPNYVQIGNSDLIEKRTHRVVPEQGGLTLSDFVPFYFTPRSPMLLNILSGWNGLRERPKEEIAILVSSIPTLMAKDVPFVFSDRHAYLETADFSSDISDLKHLDWDSWRRSDFKRRPNDPGHLEQYQAEVLVKSYLPVHCIRVIAVCSEPVENQIADICDAANVKCAVKDKWFPK